MPRPPAHLTFAFLALAALSSGCAAARVRVAPDLAATAPHQVEGANPRRWGAPVRFGPHATGPVSGADTLGWSVALFGAGVSSSHRPFAWETTGPGGRVAAECHQRGLEVFAQAGDGRDPGKAAFTFDVAGATGRPALACAFRPDAGPGPFTLALRATGRPEPAFRGELRGAGQRYTVRSVHTLEGTPIPLGTPAGWALERDGRVVAMLETTGAGRVWMDDAAPEAGAVAAAVTALLLFEPEPG
jgi:hypothetical protein